MNHVSAASVSDTSTPASAQGRIWALRPVDEHALAAMRQAHGLPELVARLLLSRGITLEEAPHFLQPSLRDSLPDPSHLLDMDVATARLVKAVLRGERIAIFGDYDVDGATSSALLVRYFRALGLDPLVYIPDRMKEGYGPNAGAFAQLRKAGASIVITVDCGTLAFEPIDEAVRLGLEVIVVDHHQGEARKPAALAIINPNRLDESSQCGQLAAVGVAFLLVVALQRELRSAGFFTAQRREPDIRQWLDIVALGTVCDVVPLTGVNRAFVAQGLKVMGGRSNPGITSLLDRAGIEERPGVYACGFIVGPRINAGGRVGRSDLGVRLLTSDDAHEISGLSAELEQHNAERKTIEALALEQAMAMAEAMPTELPLLVVASKGWHPGVIGIVAGRLKERFDKPVAIVALEGGLGKASARSVPGVDMGAAVIAARTEGLLLAGGGHAMAAGFTVEEPQLEALTAYLCEHVKRQRAGQPVRRELWLDGIITASGATPELVAQLEALAPFGQGNREPRLWLHKVTNLKVDIVGEHHVKVLLIDSQGSGRVQAIAFRAVGTPLGDALLGSRGKAIQVAGSPRLSRWNGQEKVDFHIEDVLIGG
jgi:single-stranded-DNA-specific exonuclease